MYLVSVFICLVKTMQICGWSPADKIAENGIGVTKNGEKATGPYFTWLMISSA